MKTRSDAEILELLVDTAQNDSNIRAVILEGSRAIETGQKDPFQDFDIIFAVKIIDPYKNNSEWIRRFGELMILQMPDGIGESPILDYKFTYLMQFLDGSRIDLNCYLLDHLMQHTFTEPHKVLLGKDSIFRSRPVVGEEVYSSKKPSEKEFADCCNEFWWVAPKYRLLPDCYSSKHEC